MIVTPFIRTAAVILNRRSGTILELGVERVHEIVRKGFAEAQIDAEILMVEGEEINEALDEAAESGCDAVIVGGGDGTVRSAARRLIGTEKVLGILPLGTFNLLARDLGMPLDLEEAVAALGNGRVRRIDTAEINGSPFLCVCVIGFYPSVARRREKLRGTPVWKMLPFLLTSFWRAATMLPSLNLEFRTEETRHRAETRFVAITSNRYDDVLGVIPKRATLDSGELTAYVSRHQSRWAMFCSAVRYLVGRWEEDKELSIYSSDEMTVRPRKRKRTLVIVDGEVEVREFPLEFRIRRRALALIFPPEPREEKA